MIKTRICRCMRRRTRYFVLVAIVVGAAAGGLVWGIVSFAGGSDAIDKLSNDWGKKLIYGDK